ncbi:MAG TPA: ABC transporter permease subunit [Thermohalobaculum sp.]|nr:ABC transporter permease subunit [Thermohalobaculum sp.]
MAETQVPGRRGAKTWPPVAFLAEKFSAGAASPGDSYGAPGTGNSTAIAVVSSITLFVLWFLLTMGEAPLIQPMFLPSPLAVWAKFIAVGFDGYQGHTLWEHTWASLKRIFIAFFLATAIGIPVGIAMAVNRFMRGIFDPPIEFYRPLPPLGYLPLTVIWFGIDETQKLVLLFLAMFAPIVLNARAGVRSVAIEQIHAAYSMGATRAQVLWHVILKGALPEILTGLRIGIGFGWTTLVAAELVATQEGLGAMIMTASEFLVTDIVVMGIIVIGLIAYMFDMLMREIERRLVPWKGKA